MKHKKYECDICKRKVIWEADRGNIEIDKTGQQYIIPNEYLPYKQLENGKIMLKNGDIVYWSELLLMPRIFLCYECAKKKGWR